MAIAFDTSGNTISTVSPMNIDITAAATGAWCYCYWGTRHGGTDNTPTTPSGWTRVGAVNSETSGFTNTAIFRRKKVGGDTTFSVSFTTSDHAVLAWASYTGVDDVTPDDGAGTYLAHTASSASYVTPSVSNSFTNGWAVGMFMAGSSTATRTFTADAALVERQDITNATNTFSIIELADSNGAVTVASHSYTATLSAAESHGGCSLIYLKPAVATLPPPPLVIPNVAITRASFY